MFKRITGVAAVTLGILAAGVAPALADSPHFNSTSVSGPSSDGTLTVTFKEAGLGNNQNITYQFHADSTASYACINHGGKHPQAANKETVNGPVNTTGTFSSGKNGSINGTLTLSPPSAGTFTCPGGQHLVLASVSYTNVSLTDVTNNLSANLPGTFSRTFYVF